MHWTYTRQLPTTYSATPLRQQLTNWRLPSHLIHDLRIHQRVLVNGAYRSMNQLVSSGDIVQLTFYPLTSRNLSPTSIPIVPPRWPFCMNRLIC